jgi:hypothetical protein
MRNYRSHLLARAKRRNPAVFAALLGTAHARGMITRRRRRRGRCSHSIITYSIVHLLTAAYSIQPYFALYRPSLYRRRLRGEDAHGGRSGINWFRLNFSTEREVRRAVERGALLTAEDMAAAVAASEQQGPSKFVGVSWNKRERKWVAQLNHDGNAHRLGRFDDEQHAARTFDTAARRLRGEDAHGGRSKHGNLYRLNFPTASNWTTEEWGAAQLNQPHKPSDIRKRSATKRNEDGRVE